MNDLKEIRKNLVHFKKKFEDRNVKFDVDNFKKKDILNRNLISKKEKLEQEKKILSKSKDKTNFEKSKKISKEIVELDKKQVNSQKELDKIIFFANVAHDDVPIGKDEGFNKLIKKEGIIKDFSFKVKSHIELCSKNNNIDFDTSIKLSGSRFVLKDKIALLERL